MITWVLKESANCYPYDLICVLLNDDRLLFIHEDGHHDIQHIETGMPTLGMWWRFE